MKSLLIVAAACALCATAQEREKPPAGSAPKPFTVPPRQNWTLANGMTASMVQYGTIPKVLITAVIRAGNLNEGPNQVWLADLTGEMMKEGAGSRNGIQIAEEAGRMGGQLNVTVGPDTTQISINVLSEFAPDAIALVADVAQRPTLPASEFSRLQADQLRRLAVALSRPQAIADELFYKTTYGDHPYARLFPTEAMIKAYTVDDVRKFYRANFGAGRTRLYVAGRFDPSLRKTVDTAFQRWERGPDIAVNVPKPSAQKRLLTSDRPGAPQSVVRLGLPVPDPSQRDYIPLRVTDSLLGGSFMSRITTNIREQKGYTYSPFSTIIPHYRDAFWVEEADITTDKTGPALTEIFSEITKLRSTAPAADELKGIEENMTGIFIMRNSSPLGITNQLSFVDLHGLGDAWLNTYVQNVNAVSAGDVQRIAEKYLTPNKMTLVVVGDLSKIKDQIEPFGK